MAATNQTQLWSNSSLLLNETSNATVDVRSWKGRAKDDDSGGLPMWVPLVAIIVVLVVIVLVVYFKRQSKYASLRDSLMPASNWRLSASSLGLMSDPADPSQPPVTPLSADSQRTAGWEHQFFDDDAVYRPSTTGGSGIGLTARSQSHNAPAGAQQTASPTRLQLEFSAPLRI